jgi:hypothetical protein
MPFISCLHLLSFQVALLVQDVIPEPPAEEPLWWPRGSALLLWVIVMGLLIAFIVWVLRNPPGGRPDRAKEK